MAERVPPPLYRTRWLIQPQPLSPVGMWKKQTKKHAGYQNLSLQTNLENASCDPYPSIIMHPDVYHRSHPFHQVLGAQDREKVVSVRRKVGGKWMLPEKQVPLSENM